MPTLTFAARCDTGPLRMHNEDAVAAFTAAGLHSDRDDLAGALPTATGVALVVLDGMGGHSSGDVACRRICQFLGVHLACAWPAEAEARSEWLVDLLRRASDDVLAMGEMFAGQSAAVALAAVHGDVVHVVHVGDARVYLLRGGQLEQLTRDDSLVNFARDSGVPEADLRHLPPKVVLQIVGFGKPEPHLRTLQLAPGEALMLASDGLYDAVDAAEIAAVLRTREPAEACAELLDLAVRAPSADNICVLVAQLGDSSATS